MVLCDRCTVLGPQCCLQSASVQHQMGPPLQGLPDSSASQMPLQPSASMWLLAALQVLAVSTHNHYRRVQDRMRKKQQQEARETAAANAGKMQAPAGPSGQAQVGCTTLLVTRRWVAGQGSTMVQHLAGEPDMLHRCKTLQQGTGPASGFPAQQPCCRLRRGSAAMHFVECCNSTLFAANTPPGGLCTPWQVCTGL